MLKVAVIGATGAVGQEFVLALNRHPWFEVTQIASSERSAGKRYINALRDPTTGITKGHNKQQIPEYIQDMIIRKVEDINQQEIDIFYLSYDHILYIFRNLLFVMPFCYSCCRVTKCIYIPFSS